MKGEMLTKVHACKSEKDLSQILESESALIFKHSTACGSSARAYDEMKLFAHRPLSIPVHMIRVIEERALSRRVEELLGVEHESPQVIRVKNGRALWSLSHSDITVEAVQEKLARES